MERVASQQPIGIVEVQNVPYAILGLNGDHFQVVRHDDGRRIGRFRGSPTSMWLLEADDDLDLLRVIVTCAIAEGVVTDVPTD